MKWYESVANQTAIAMAIYVAIVATLFLATGCSSQKRLTKSEWDSMYKPATVLEAQAKIELEKGQQKVKDDALMAKIERACIVVGIVAVVAIGVLLFMKANHILFIPVSVIIGCLAGIFFVEFRETYPKVLPIAGGLGLTAFSGVSVYLLAAKSKIWKVFKEAINADERNGNSVSKALEHGSNDAKKFLKKAKCKK